MRILIDLQGAQSASRYRGIGRYSLSLVLAMIRNAGDHEIWLILNAAFPESVLEIRKQVHGLVPPERIRVFDVPAPVVENEPANQWRIYVAEKIREYFIYQLHPHVVFITSLFEGYNDNAVASIGTFCTGVYTAVILYDLVQLLHPDIYLSTLVKKQYYHRKLESLKNAGLLLAISDYSKQSAVEMLGLAPEKIVNISSAVDASFAPRSFSFEEKQAFCKRYGIARKIILYVPGGFDTRKNIQGLFTAYGLLSAKLRQDYQLVVTSKMNETEESELENIRARTGIEYNAIVITGYVPENDLITLYNLAALFVFPSKQEGFGLPILEAMACGVPVIGSNSSSIPEAIGYDAALFDANSPQAIADKIEQALNDQQFYNQLREHGLEQVKKFSWDISAKRALRALEIHAATVSRTVAQAATPLDDLKTKKLRLAFVAPLPPERTGIADYCIELLPDLMNYFEIELVTDQAEIKLPSSLSSLTRRSVSWFKEHGAYYDRIVYQFGNSPFHSHMLALLRQHPGAVVLHDFFLSGMLAYEEMFGNMPAVWTKALYHSHGYLAVQTRFAENAIENTKNFYPCNLEVLQNARGVIVHSKYAQQLAYQWYGNHASKDWKIVPQLCAAPVAAGDRLAARKALGISEQAFIVCSFGFIDPTKFSAKLLEAWLSSQLHVQPDCELVLVGENHGGEYGAQIIQRIYNSGSKIKIRITGWLEKQAYTYYLQAADVCVQLRGISRGETSRTVLECMSYGLAAIVNANGSMAELPADNVWMLPDEFTEAELAKALETVWQDDKLCKKLAAQARETVLKKHDPQSCATQCVQAIESIYANTTPNMHDLLKAIVTLDNLPSAAASLKYIAQTIAIACRPKPLQKQLLIDVTSIMRNDLKTGIERVVRAQLLELIKNPPVGFRVEPVYLMKQDEVWCCRYARKFMFNLLGVPSFGLLDNPIDVYPGDIYYAADFAPYELIQAARSGLLTYWRVIGAHLNVLVYDLLPILRPEFFPAGAAVTHTDWLKEIASFADRLIGISAAVADELRCWLKENGIKARATSLQPLKICAAPLGADIAASAPTVGLPATAGEFLTQLQQTTSFLMVGTIEPRKGHWQALTAFEQLWQQGHQIQLVIVGKEGWIHLPESERCTIPIIVDKITRHPELNKRLFWLPEVSDEYLQKIYAASTCLLAASEGEGFGLPLIEAARYQLPIIARDLPVFHELAQQHAYYFSGLSREELATAIKHWLVLYAEHKAPSSVALRWDTWAQHTEKLVAVLTGQEPEHVCTVYEAVSTEA